MEQSGVEGAKARAWVANARVGCAVRCGAWRGGSTEFSPCPFGAAFLNIQDLFGMHRCHFKAGEWVILSLGVQPTHHPTFRPALQSTAIPIALLRSRPDKHRDELGTASCAVA